MKKVTFMIAGLKSDLRDEPELIKKYKNNIFDIHNSNENQYQRHLIVISNMYRKCKFKNVGNINYNSSLPVVIVNLICKYSKYCNEKCFVNENDAIAIGREFGAYDWQKRSQDRANAQRRKAKFRKNRRNNYIYECKTMEKSSRYGDITPIFITIVEAAMFAKKHREKHCIVM